MNILHRRLADERAAHADSQAVWGGLFPASFEVRSSHSLGQGDPALWMIANAPRCSCRSAPCSSRFGVHLSLLTVAVSIQARDFLLALVRTWWELGRSIVSFWAILRFVWNAAGAVVTAARMLATAIWLLTQTSCCTGAVGAKRRRKPRGPGVPCSRPVDAAWCLLRRWSSRTS